MAVLDASIPLKAIGQVQPPPDLRELALLGLHIEKVKQERTESAALRDVFGRHAASLDTPEGQQNLLKDIARVAPRHYAGVQQAMAHAQQQQRLAAKEQREALRDELGIIGQIAGAVLAADDDHGPEAAQKAYERGMGQAVRVFGRQALADWPSTYDRARVEQAYRQALSLSKQLSQAERAEQQRGRQEAGAAAAVLTDPTLTLDPEARAGMRGIVTRQQAREGKLTEVQKRVETQQDQARRQELAATLQDLVSEADPQQQQLVGALLEAYSAGELKDETLFKTLDKLTATTTMPSSVLQLSYLAAGTGPRSAQARKALQLMPQEVTRVTTAQIAYMASQGDEQAQAALKMLEQLRQTGVVKEEKEPRGKSFTDKRSTPAAPGQVPDPTFKGERFEGQGGALPQIKSFKRIR